MNEWQDYSLLGDTLLVIRNMFQDVEVAVNFRTLMYEVGVEDAHYGSITGREGMVECGTDLRYTFKRREYEARIFDHKIMQRIYHFIQMKLKAIVNGSYKLYLKCME